MTFKKKPMPTLSGPLPDYWISYSDLMSGLLLVFVLLLVVSMYHYSDFIAEKEQRVKERDEVLMQQEIRLLAFEKQKVELIAALKKSLREIDVQVDELTGVVQIGEGLLFEEDMAEIRPQGQQKLELIYQKYIQIVLAPEFQGAVDRIVIEGHTNSRGSYLHNLSLSQQRANAVMRSWLELAGQDRKKLEEKIVSSGRSWADLILNEMGEEDAIRSRRIEIAFRLKESELMRSVYEKVKGKGHGDP